MNQIKVAASSRRSPGKDRADQARGDDARIFLENIDKVKITEFASTQIFRIIDAVELHGGQLVVDTNLTKQHSSISFGDMIAIRVRRLCNPQEFGFCKQTQISLSSPDQAMATTRQIKILTVDDHPILRKGIASIIQGEKDIVVVGQQERLHIARDITRDIESVSLRAIPVKG
jgi:hypothetical protein